MGPQKAGIVPAFFLFFGMSFCYIIFSPTLQKFYIGITQESIQARIENHNHHRYGKKRFTAKASDWELFLAIETQSLSHARRIEIYLKKMKSSKYIQKLKSEPELVKQILFQTQ